MHERHRAQPDRFHLQQCLPRGAEAPEPPENAERHERASTCAEEIDDGAADEAKAFCV
jgi:hypothetical protein